jgi:hypothetical protein
VRAACISDSEITSFEDSAQRGCARDDSAGEDCAFGLYPLRFGFIARRALYFPPGQTANLLRGRIGKALMDSSPGDYEPLFAPSAANGPSGLRDLPRPFVLRVAHLDGARFHPGERFEIGLNLFTAREPAIALLSRALCSAEDAELTDLDGDEQLRLSLAPYDRAVRQVRVRFLSPTELKGGAQPLFGVLFARIRDRVSTLRALYGGGPLPINFQNIGERAKRVRMTRCDLEYVDAARVSRSTGQRHSLGGFIGVAEYEGELEEFAPYLEAARFTGVGRQTVWGKGEICWEEI